MLENNRSEGVLLPEVAEKVPLRRAVPLSRGMASKALREEHLDFQEQKNLETIGR